MKNNWFRLGLFWFSDATYLSKREMFRSRVRGMGISVLETCFANCV